MITHKISKFSGLLQEMNRIANAFCTRNKLPKISVIPDNGTIEPEARAAYNWRKHKIMVSSRLLTYLQEHPNRIKVWGLYSAIRHELRHYEQYLFLHTKYKRVTRDIFDEEDAILTGRLFADRNISNLTPSQINPILESFGSSVVAGLGLGVGFKGIDLLATKLRKKG